MALFISTNAAPDPLEQVYPGTATQYSHNVYVSYNYKLGYNHDNSIIETPRTVHGHYTARGCSENSIKSCDLYGENMKSQNTRKKYSSTCFETTVERKRDVTMVEAPIQAIRCIWSVDFV